MMRREDLWLSYLCLITLLGILAFLTLDTVRASEVRVIRLNDKTVARVDVTPRGTVLSFPVKPSQVLLGKAGAFAIKYVENDLAVSPTSPVSRSNLFVYLEGRRFTFDLVTSAAGGHAIVQVRDSSDVIERTGDRGK